MRMSVRAVLARHVRTANPAAAVAIPTAGTLGVMLAEGIVTSLAISAFIALCKFGWKKLVAAGGKKVATQMAKKVAVEGEKKVLKLTEKEAVDIVSAIGEGAVIQLAAREKVIPKSHVDDLYSDDPEKVKAAAKELQAILDKANQKGTPKPAQPQGSSNPSEDSKPPEGGKKTTEEAPASHPRGKAKPPAGYKKIPGSKKGGYRKKNSDGTWDRWYPPS